MAEQGLALGLVKEVMVAHQFLAPSARLAAAAAVLTATACKTAATAALAALLERTLLSRQQVLQVRALQVKALMRAPQLLLAAALELAVVVAQVAWELMEVAPPLGLEALALHPLSRGQQ